MAAKRKPEPRRIRLMIPRADESALAWIDLQDDASGSMRALIRGSIARDGYVDVINQPVERQPRRGRPPADINGQAGPAGLSGSSADGTEPSVLGPEAQEPAAPAPSTSTLPAPVDDDPRTNDAIMDLLA
ncbi:MULTISPECIES: hypothetical protein [Arthrobacter]|uniref:Uncharacterized protein n=1 Tax=Arthrobacter terricola TaxID=2547396 RepID=A0A4R5K255_9MICC|nr:MULTISPECIES: hypothetical protein [Arthrobacter]MBT8163184.1 hypothetical protein [Arthrobacter sp. GN70]TDF85374.1 hypothetical protein E1809_25900 [Arthrobacter terricola]